MKTTLDILNQLKKVLEEELDYKDFIVQLDYPDTDRCIKPTTIFLTPETGIIEGLTTGSDSCSLDVTLYIICRRKKDNALMENVFRCYEEVYKLLRNNPHLDEFVADTIINDFDYYPSTGVDSEKAIEVRLTMIWEKDFNSLN